MNWTDPPANTPADRWQTLALVAVATAGAVAVLGILAARDQEAAPLIRYDTAHATNATVSLPCPEDSALVWLDAPNTARCVALDDWADAASLARLDALLGR